METTTIIKKESGLLRIIASTLWALIPFARRRGIRMNRAPQEDYPAKGPFPHKIHDQPGIKIYKIPPAYKTPEAILAEIKTMEKHTQNVQS